MLLRKGERKPERVDVNKNGVFAWSWSVFGMD